MRKSLNKRIPEHIFSRIHEDIGEASMCWDKIPTGVFDSTNAGRIAFNLCHFVADEIDKAVELKKTVV
jgi:hypothetical protein